MLALIAKIPLKALLEERGLRIEIKGIDQTPAHRPLVNIYRNDGREVGAMLRAGGFAREWRPHKRNDWCRVADTAQNYSFQCSFLAFELPLVMHW